MYLRPRQTKPNTLLIPILITKPYSQNLHLILGVFEIYFQGFNLKNKSFGNKYKYLATTQDEF